MKIIVLDRDGVINEDSDDYIKTPEEWQPIPGSLEAIALLKKRGWTVAVATNQSGIRRGYYNRQTLHAMHQKFQALLQSYSVGIDWISYSPYVADDESPCRKPQTGMLRAIENRFGCSLQGQPMEGDSLADIRVAKTHKMQPFLVKTGKGQRTIDSLDPCLEGVPVYDSLAAAVEKNWL